MQITIPNRIAEAINQGEALKMSKFAGHYSATLIDTNTAKIHGRKADTPQEAPDNLEAALDMTLVNTYGASKGGRL